MNARRQQRNPGPAWGIPLLSTLDRVLPPTIMRAAIGFGSWFALPVMAAQRSASREYLEALRGRTATVRDVQRHYSALMENLWMKLRVGNGREHAFEFAPDAGEGQAFAELARSDQPALFGSLHVGQADLLGYFLHLFGRRVHMVRLQVENAFDQELLASRFGESVRYIWVNDPRAMLFTLKQSLDEGATLALQCDRLEFGARQAAFRFLGGERLFPVTIYHLAWLYRRPVAFAFGFPAGNDRSRVHCSRILPMPEGIGKAAYLSEAHDHFQSVLDLLEGCLRQHPYQWFNFLPLNPVVQDERGLPRARTSSDILRSR